MLDTPPALQIVSGSRDKTIKLWNTLGECKYTIGEPDGHLEWVSCVRFSPVTTNPIIVSAGWDKLVKVSSPTDLAHTNHTVMQFFLLGACAFVLVCPVAIAGLISDFQCNHQPLMLSCATRVPWG